MRGRPPKTTNELKLHGTFRRHRHGARSEPEATGSLVKPAGLSPVASAHWDEVAPRLTWARASDSPAVRTLCEMWELYRAAFDAAKKAPADKELRCAVLGYKQAWESLASKLGLTPVDRTRIRADEPAKASTGPRTRSRA